MIQNSLSPVLRRWRFIAAAVGVTALAGGGVLYAASSDPATALAFHSVPSTRVLDIRAASQVGAFSAPLGAASTLDFVVPGLPDDAKSVSLNVTVTDGSQASFLVVYPSGDARPSTSSVNWSSVNAVANTATVNVAADHSLRVYNDQGSVNVIIDLLGYYAPSPVGSGPAGPPGTPGAPGTPGSNATISSGNWGVILRNTIGSPDIDLRGGPHVNATAPFGSPPLGTGSLQFLINVVPAIPAGGGGVPAIPAAPEKASYGNEIDFFGDPVAGLTAVGYRVFTTLEDEPAGIVNMPGITFEVDPNLTADPFSSLVFQPSANSPADQWSDYIDATSDAAGRWFLTSTAGTLTGCNQATPCTFTAIKAALPQATIYTAAVTKGRDFAWQGAIDGFRVNNEVFDFEESGVRVTAP